MLFSELKIGDNFDVELPEGEVKFIKIEQVETWPGPNLATYNAVCIDNYSPEKGHLWWFDFNKSVIHINWS